MTDRFSTLPTTSIVRTAFVLQVVSRETGASGSVWSWANHIPFSVLGFYIVGIFLASWLVSVIVYKVRRIDQLDEALAQASSPALSSSGR